MVINERKPQPGEFGASSPDLAVEIVSANDTQGEIDDKVDQYLAGGSRLVWVVYPRSRVAIVYRPDQEPFAVSSDGTLDGDDVLPGFKLLMRKVFDF